MNFRRARPADLDVVLAIEGAWPTTPHWTRRQFEAELQGPGSIFLVAEDAAGIAGYGVIWRVPPEAQLLNLAVSPKRIRKGAGRELLQALSILAHGTGCSVMTLEVSERNAPARALYEKAGFRVVGRRPKFYNDGSDAVLMDLHL